MQHYLDVSTLSDLSGFTQRGSTAGTFDLFDDSGVDTIRRAVAGFNSGAFVSWDEVGNGAGTDEIEVALLMRCIGAEFERTGGPAARGHVDGSFLGISMQRMGEGAAGLNNGENAGSFIGETFDDASGWSTQDEWHWCRYRLATDGSVTDVSIKTWLMAAGEPGSWTRVYADRADAYHGQTGYAGFAVKGNTGTLLIRAIGVGTGGDSAPIAPMSSGETGDITSASESDAGFSATVHQPASLIAGAASADQYAPIAHVAVAIVGAAASAETQGDAAAVFAAISAPATGDAMLDAIAQASAALAAGGSAGEAWVSGVQALADLIAGGAADEMIAAQVSTPGATTIAAGSASEAQFATAVQALADLVAGGSAAAAMAALTSAIGALSAGAAAGAQLSAQAADANARALTASGAAAELWSAVAAVSAAILESVGADAIWTATAAVSAAVTARAAAGATFAAQLAESGYVVVGAIRFLAAVSGRTSIRPAVTGTVKIKPH